jgi:hypothetical protein
VTTSAGAASATRARPLPVRAGARTGAATAALGLGLLAAALGAEHVAAHPLVGVPLVALAAAALTWSVLALRGPVPGVAGTVAALLVTGPAVLLSPLPAGSVPGLAEAAGATLALGAAITLALGVRLGHARHAPRPWGQLGALALAALLVATITVPGLAATEAGARAVPHGSHGLPAEHAHHGG